MLSLCDSFYGIWGDMVRKLGRTLTAILIGTLVSTSVVMAIAVVWARFGGPPIGLVPEDMLEQSLKSVMFMGPLLAAFVFAVMLIVYLPATLIFRHYGLTGLTVHVLPFVLLVLVLAIIGGDFFLNHLCL